MAWAGGRNLVAVLPTLDYGYMLTNLGKSITIGSALLLIGYDKKKWAYTFACVCIGIFFLIGGIQHFIFIDFVKTLVPRWIPGDVFWSYVAGVGLAAAGVALITGIQRKLAALIAAYMVFIWFLILHIPLGFGETASFNEWIAVFESLFVSATLVVIYHKS
ncbi:MAG: DoxX family membrane protein [Bacteroidota bacterium]